MALLVSIQPTTILDKTANYMRVSIARYDLKGTDCVARFDLLDSTSRYDEAYDKFEQIYHVNPLLIKQYFQSY